MESSAAVVIRNASEDEKPAIMAMVLDSYAEFAGRMQPQHWTQMQANLRKLVAGATPLQLMVAKLDGRAVGTVSYYAPDDTPGSAGFTAFPPDWAVMRVLAVDPAFRGRGVGRLLAHHTVERARTEGAATIGLYTSELMISARRIYHDLGFEQHSRIQHLGLTFDLYKLVL